MVTGLLPACLGHHRGGGGGAAPACQPL